MSFTYINKIALLICLIFVISCQKKLNIFNDVADKNIQNNNLSIQVSKKIIDTNTDYKNSKIIDFYSNEHVDYNFLQKKINKIKINNFEESYGDNLAINIFYNKTFLYSINSNGELLKFDKNTGKLLDKYIIDIPFSNKLPISLSLIGNDFLIAFNSGEIIKCDNRGKVIWSYQKKSLLNTPIKFFNDNLIILYPEDIVILSNKSGKLIFEKKFKSSNIIQSSGGKILNYYNLIFFILPNSEFISFDTLLLEENTSNLDNLKINTPLNNLKDNIHLYNDLFVYLDNGDTLNTYDLSSNQFVLNNQIINNIKSHQFYNNSLIVKNNDSIKFYNISDGKLLLNLNTYKKLKKDSILIKVLNINNKLHLFTDQGKILILNNDLAIKTIVDLNIRRINKIFNYQDQIFISTKKGITYILK